jgi:hypothetical protein
MRTIPPTPNKVAARDRALGEFGQAQAAHAGARELLRVAEEIVRGKLEAEEAALRALAELEGRQRAAKLAGAPKDALAAFERKLQAARDDVAITRFERDAAQYARQPVFKEYMTARTKEERASAALEAARAAAVPRLVEVS